MMHLLIPLLILSRTTPVKTESDPKSNHLTTETPPSISDPEKISEIDSSPPSTQSSTISALELLLKKQIKGAQCAARCSIFEEEEGEGLKLEHKTFDGIIAN